MFARTLTALFLCAAPALAASPQAPMPRAVGELPPKYSVWNPEACSPEQVQLWHRMNFSSAYNTPSPFFSHECGRVLTPIPHRVSFSCQRDQAYREAEYMKRYQEPVRFKPQPPVVQEASESTKIVPSVDPLVCPPCPLPKIEVNPLLGTWFREVPGCVACATFTHDELKLAFAESDGTKHTATAQYTVTKDGLVFGAITGTSGPASLVDVPFSFRFRVTSDGVMVSAFKSEPMGDVARFCGLFKSAKDGKVPAPVAAKPAPGAVMQWKEPVRPDWLQTPRTVPPPALEGAPSQPEWIRPVRPASLESAPAVLPPALDGPPPMPPKRPNASAPPDASKQFADEAFGALLQQSGILPKPKAEEETWMGGMTLPPPQYLEHFPKYIGPDPAFPIPRELAEMEAAPAKKKLAHVGTWHRELGPMTCVVKIDAEHVSITASMSAEENGKKVTQGVVITGDYHLARDGTTLVGLVTGLDVILEGVTAKEVESLGIEEVAKMQKGLVGQPFALGVRAYGDVLVIGDVRAGHASERGIEEASALVAGRYKSGEPKAAKPKRLPRATGATVPRIPMADADEHARVKELLYESDTSGPPGFFWKQEYSSDPNVRMKQLRYQSEDLRQIENEWRRFWSECDLSEWNPWKRDVFSMIY